MDYVYLNNALVARSKASIPIDNRGFRFGDGVFETIRVHNGALYLLEKHLLRLAYGVEQLRLSYAHAGLKSRLEKLIKKNKVKEGIARILLTRTGPSRGYLPLSNDTLCLIETEALPALPHKPQDLWVSRLRRTDPRAMPVQAKLMQGINPMLARLEAQEHGCFEALLLGRNGRITEGSSSTIFWFHKQHLYTPGLENGLVMGVLRERIIELSPFPVEQGRYTLEHIRHAEEVFMCNTVWGIVPIHHLLPLDVAYSKFRQTHHLQRIMKEDLGHAAS